MARSSDGRTSDILVGSNGLDFVTESETSVFTIDRSGNMNIGLRGSSGSSKLKLKM